MDTINNDLTNLLKQMGVHQESWGITQRIVIIAGILIIAFVADYFVENSSSYYKETDGKDSGYLG